MYRASKVLLIALLVMVISASAYAFAAANTVPASKAGSGSGTVSGYTVSNIGYNLDASNPAQLDSVDFTLSDTAATVKIKLVAAGSTWFDCTVVTDNDWTCDTAGASVATMDELNVVAASN